MGIGPVPAIEGLLKATCKTLDDMDMIEVSSLLQILSNNRTVFCFQSKN